MKLATFAATALMAMALTACGSKLNGTYAANMSGMNVSYTFKSNGKVEMDTMGMRVEADYKVEGKDVKISTEGQPAIILTLEDENTISGPMGLKLKKSS